MDDAEERRICRFVRPDGFVSEMIRETESALRLAGAGRRATGLTLGRGRCRIVWIARVDAPGSLPPWLATTGELIVGNVGRFADRPESFIVRVTPGHRVV